MSDDKSGSPPCGIYIRIDDFSDMKKIITQLREMALVINRASGYEKNMHAIELKHDGSTETAERINDLVQIIQAQGLVAILSGDIKGFDIGDADGILLDDANQIKDACTVLSDDNKIIGLSCGASKDIAQKAIAMDIDYVTLNADPTLVSWWAGQTEKLCMASGSDISPDNCKSLVNAGAEFVDVTNYILNYEKGVMQSTVNILHAIEAAAQIPEKLN